MTTDFYIKNENGIERLDIDKIIHNWLKERRLTHLKFKIQKVDDPKEKEVAIDQLEKDSKADGEEYKLEDYDENKLFEVEYQQNEWFLQLEFRDNEYKYISTKIFLNKYGSLETANEFKIRYGEVPAMLCEIFCELIFDLKSFKFLSYKEVAKYLKETTND